MGFDTDNLDQASTIGALVPMDAELPFDGASVGEDADDDSVFVNSSSLPAITTPLTVLFAEHAEIKHQIAKCSEMIETYKTAFQCFLKAQERPDARRYFTGGHASFCAETAVKVLDADYWRKVISLTDLFSIMPTEKRREWEKQIDELKNPPFEPDSVRATLQQLFAERESLLAEKVDGIFRGLSGSHLTNCPEGFSARMVIWTGGPKAMGLIHDLRCVVASFLGHEPPKREGLTEQMIVGISSDGKWVVLDAGAMRIRKYKKGTAHFEVHPDIAWRLNKVLSHMYPLAIPSQFRKPPKKQHKEFELRLNRLPHKVCEQLETLVYYNPNPNRNDVDPNTIFLQAEKEYREDIETLFESLGGVQTKPSFWTFDYPVRSVVRDIFRTGCVPDDKSFQFYPTPEPMAREMVDLLCVQDDDSCLEPSAGNAAIAKYLPKDQTQCVEISSLRCKILEAHGYKVDEADFLSWKPDAKFSKICANPPFSEGRAKAHVLKMISHLQSGGRLVVVLPGSLRGHTFHPDCSHYWGPLRFDEFKGTGVCVSILTLDKP